MLLLSGETGMVLASAPPVAALGALALAVASLPACSAAKIGPGAKSAETSAADTSAADEKNDFSKAASTLAATRDGTLILVFMSFESCCCLAINA
jgi:hypothetical protein